MTRTSDLLTIRCPEDLLQAITERVEATGQRKTDVVIKALRVGLGVEAGFPANSNNGVAHQSDYLNKRLEEMEAKLASEFKEKHDAFVQHCQEVVKQILQQVVKRAEDEAHTRFDILVQQKLSNVQQAVKQTVQQDVGQPENFVVHNVKQPVQQLEDSVKQLVQQNVEQTESETTQGFDKHVKQTTPVVQQTVQHATDEVLDDAAFVTDTAEDEEINRLCEPIPDYDETPNRSDGSVPDAATKGEQSPTPTAKTATTSSGTASLPEASNSPIVPEEAHPTQERKRRRRAAASVEEQVPTQNTDSVSATKTTAKERARAYPAIPMNSAGLSKRLDIDQSAISRNKEKGNEHFQGWSAEKDPQGVAWEYRTDEKPHYHPVLPQYN